MRTAARFLLAFCTILTLGAIGQAQTVTFQNAGIGANWDCNFNEAPLPGDGTKSTQLSISFSSGTQTCGTGKSAVAASLGGTISITIPPGLTATLDSGTGQYMLSSPVVMQIQSANGSFTSGTAAPTNPNQIELDGDGVDNCTSPTGSIQMITTGSGSLSLSETCTFSELPVAQLPGTVLDSGIEFDGAITDPSGNSVGISFSVDFYLAVSASGPPPPPCTFSLSSSSVTLNGAQGGSPVTGALMLTSNCITSQSWSSSITPLSPSWLQVSPSSDTLGAGATETLTLTATPGSLTANQTATLTISPSGSATFTPVTANVMFNLSSCSMSLAPATQTLQGNVGGTGVTGTLTLTNNCSTSQNWSAASTSTPTNWLTILEPDAGILGPGQSVTIDIAGTPGTLKSTDTPTGTITVSAVSGSAFTPASATVNFNLSTTATTITVGAVTLNGSSIGSGASAGANVEENTSLTFTVAVTYTSTGQGTIGLQITDGAATPFIVTSVSQPITQAGTQTATLTLTYTFPAGTPSLFLAGTFAVAEWDLVAYVAPTGQSAILASAGSLSVYPQASLTLGLGASTIWAAPATAPGPILVLLNYQSGAPDRSITFSVTDDAMHNLGTIPALALDGSGIYFEILNGLTIPSSGHVNVTATIVAASAGEQKISKTAIMAVTPPPSITDFQLQNPGTKYFYVDASTPLSLPAGVSAVVGRPTFTLPSGTSGVTSTNLYELAGSSAPKLIGGGNPDDNTVAAAVTAFAGDTPRFQMTLGNGLGQTVSSAVSAPAAVTTIEITSVTFNPSGPSLQVAYTYSGPASQTFSAGYTSVDNTAATPTCPAPSASAGNTSTGSCTIPVTPTDVGAVVDVVVFAQPSFTKGFESGFHIPDAAALDAGVATTAPAGAVITPSASAGSTSISEGLAGLGLIAASGTGGSLFTASVSATPALARLASSSLASSSLASSSPASGTTISPDSVVFVGGALSFNPAVPNDSSQVVYHYQAVDLPDDPGFNPANLEVVSFDPSTGQLVSYPSQADATAQTVTATVPGIPPYLSLAVPASTLGAQLNLPVDLADAQAPATIGVFAAGSGPSSASLYARGADGTALASSPTTGTLIPGGQTSTPLPLGTQTPTNPGWVQLYASDPGTIGTALLAESSALEALPLTPSSNALTLTRVQLGSGISNEIDIANATLENNDVSVAIFNTSGTVVDQFAITLPAKGSFSGTAEAMFTKASSPLQGFIIVAGTQRLSASLLVRTGNAMNALPGQPIPSGTASATSLYAPQFVTGPGIATSLDIVNTGTSAAHITLQANADDGTLIAKPVTATIAAGAQYWIDLAGTLGLSATQFTTGSLSVISDVPGLAGDITIGDTSGFPSFRTSIALAPAETAQAIPYILNTTSLPMGIYAADTGKAKAIVTFTLYTSSGNAISSATTTIPAGGRLEEALSTLIPAAAGLTGGALEIDSDQPLSVAGLILPANPASDWAVISAQPSSLVPPTGPTPLISAGGVTNAAVAKTTLARLALATIYGSNFTTGGATYQAQTLPLPLELGGVYVTVGGVPAPLYYLNSTQINYQVPEEVPSGSTANVVVTVNGVPSAPASVAMADYALGVFSYLRTAAAYDPIIVHFKDNSIITPSNPAVPGEIVVIYATGIGKLMNPPFDGAGAPGGPLSQAVDNPTVTIGGMPSGQIYFAGLTPGGVGLAQFDVTLPSSLPSGSLPVVINFPNDSSPPVNLTVQGNLAGSPQLSVSPTSLSFGNVTIGQSKTLSVTLNNTGTATLNLTSITVTGAGFTLVALPTAESIPAGGSQPAMVTFTPTSAASFTGTLSIVSNGGTASVSLSGAGVSAGAPAISVSATSLSFGSVAAGKTASQTFTIGNTGTAALTVSSIGAPSGFSIVSPSTPFNVAAGASPVTVSVQFAPTSSTAYTGTLTIASNDPAHSSVTVAVTGTGAPATPLACGFTLDSVIYAKWTALGGSGGVLGCPTANESKTAASPQGSTGMFAPFASGAIYEHLTGPFAGQAYEIHNCTIATYATLGGSGGSYGYPTSDQYTVDGGLRNDFQGGYIAGVIGNLPSCSYFAAGLDFTGQWFSTRGNLSILQDSLDASGTYSGGTITNANQISQQTLFASWMDSTGTGAASFLLSPDGNSFTGSYYLTNSTTMMPWNGTRTGTVGWFTPSSINFGTVPVNTTVTLNFVASSTTETLTIKNFSSSNPAFQVNVGTPQLTPGATATIPIKFTPVATGPVSGTITITTLDSVRPMAVIQVTGTGQ